MRCYLPTVWQAEGLKRKNRLRRTYILSEFVEVDICEVDEKDAPVSVSSKEVSVRYFDERHWYPFSMDKSIGLPPPNERKHKRILTKVPNSYEDMTNELFKNNPLAPMRPEKYYQSEHLRTIFNPDDFREIDLSDREAAVKSCHNRAKQLILVEGYIWHCAACPVLFSRLNFEGRDNWSIIVKLAPSDSVERKLIARPKDSHMFELETDQALIRQIYPDGSTLRMPEYEVLMPEVLDGNIAGADFAYCIEEKLMDWWTLIARKRTSDELDENELQEFAKALSMLKKFKAEGESTKMADLECAVSEAVDSGFGEQFFATTLNLYRELKKRDEIIDLAEIGGN